MNQYSLTHRKPTPDFPSGWSLRMTTIPVHHYVIARVLCPIGDILLWVSGKIGGNSPEDSIRDKISLSLYGAFNGLHNYDWNHETQVAEVAIISHDAKNIAPEWYADTLDTLD